MNDSNSAQQLMAHAAMLLEEQGDVAGAEAALRDAINLAGVARRRVELIQAKAFLGELLLELERDDEAMTEFEEVVVLGEDEFLDREAVEVELAAAREHLNARGGSES